MRVLQLIDSLDAGGAERVAVNLANALAETVEASFLCATRQEGLLKNAIAPSVGYLFLDKRRTLDFKALLRLHRYVKAHRIDIIHAHSSSFFLATLVRWLQPHLKLVWHDHYGNSAFLDVRPFKVLSFCSRYFSHVFCVNPALKAWVQLHLNCKAVSYLANFAEVSETTTPVTVLKGQNGKRVLCLANLRPQKDHITLIKAFKLFHTQFPDWTLHCVGHDFEDAYSASVYDLVDLLDLNSSVFFYGSCSDSFSIIAQSAIGVLSSQSEGLPLALLEYGLGGLAVVVTDVGDCKTVVNASHLGQVVPPCDADALSETLVLYATDDAYRSTIGSAFEQHVRTHFSKSATITTIIDVYKTL